MSLEVFVTYVLERTRRSVVIGEFERACRLSKLLHPGFPTR